MKNIAPQQPPTKRRYNFLHHVSLWTFLCIFPIDATWYMLSQVSGIPRIPLGFFSLIITLTTLLPYCMYQFSSFRFYFYIMAVFLSFSAISAFISIHFDWQWLVLFVKYIGIFSCGYFLSNERVLETKLAKRSLVLSTLLCIALSIAYLRGGWGVEDEFNYLRTASSLVVSATLAVSMVFSRTLKMVIYAGALGALAILNSRTFLYIWLLLPAFTMIARQIRPKAISLNHLVYWSFAGLSVAATVYAGVRWVLPELAALGGARLLPDIEISTSAGGSNSGIETTDRSLATRIELFRLGWLQIVERPFWGYYNGYLSYGGNGSYIHNIFSYWHQFGLIPFLTLMCMIFLSFRRLFKFGHLRESNGAKTLLISLVVAALAARSHVSTELFLGLGFALGFNDKDGSRGGSLSARMQSEQPSIVGLRN